MKTDVIITTQGTMNNADREVIVKCSEIGERKLSQLIR